MITVVQSDCVKYLQSVDSCSHDVIFVDPPYNTGNKESRRVTYDRNKELEQKNWDNFHAEWDAIENYQEWATAWLKESKRILTPNGSIFVCGSHHNIFDVGVVLRQLGFYVVTHIAWCIPNAFPNLAMTKMVSANQSIIWARPNKDVTHYYDKEAAKRYNDGKNLRDYWLINNDTQAGKKWKHPSKKPADLVRRAIDISLPKRNGARVLDYFAGSGTTGIAALQLERMYDLVINTTLVDSSAEYVTMINNRVSDFESVL